ILCNLPECHFRGLEGERMQQRYSALKSLLDGRSAGYWEVNRTQLLLVELVVVVAFVGTREESKGRTNQRYLARLNHWNPLGLKSIAAHIRGQSNRRELQFINNTEFSDWWR